MLLLCAFVGGCSGFTTDDKHYSVYFPARSADLDQQGQATVQAAAAVAQKNMTLSVRLASYASPPNPEDNAVLSAQRAANVQQALISDGVDPDRIFAQPIGTTDPGALPNLAVQRVDISIGR